MGESISSVLGIIVVHTLTLLRLLVKVRLKSTMSTVSSQAFRGPPSPPRSVVTCLEALASPSDCSAVPRKAILESGIADIKEEVVADWRAECREFRIARRELT